MPYTGNVLFFLSLHAALFLILLGHWLVAGGMFPKATSAIVRQYDERPIRALLLGLVTYGPIFLLLLNSAKLPVPPRIAVIVGGVFALLIALAGTAGLAMRIGRNLSAGASRWEQCLRGGVMLALVFITPFLGWGFLLHAGLASGFGAFLLAKPWKSAASENPGIPAPALP
ncbi:MAG: hypothetical protein ABIP20_09045 [Chthoniobacteraceae bacterium]